MTLPRLLLIVAMVVSATAASADPITIVRDFRQTAAAANPNGLVNGPSHIELSQAGDSLVSVVTAPAEEGPGVASALLTSSLANSAHWFGAGSANTSWTPPAELTASAIFKPTFDVTSAVDYTFSGSLAASSTVACCRPGDLIPAVAHAFLLREQEFLPVFSMAASGSPLDSSTFSRSVTGVLLPGRYQLDVAAIAFGIAPGSTMPSGSSVANFAFTLDFAAANPNDGPSPTPEPTSLLLLGTAIAGLFTFSTRFRHHAH